MNSVKPLTISQIDYDKISALLDTATLQIAELLEEELSRANIVDEKDLPEDVVAMYSEVEFMDIDSKTKQKVTLVYPPDSNIEENKISILAPVGAALIGLHIGDSITWPISENKVKRIKVTNVIPKKESDV